jgi:multidrug efflux pump subunit AcrA (membrane-fusion protein)
MQRFSLSVRQFSYTNPVSGLFEAAGTNGPWLVEALRLLLTAGPLRKEAQARAEVAAQDAIIREATFEAEVENRIEDLATAELENAERELRIERMRIENERERIKLETEVLGAEAQRLQLALEIANARRELAKDFPEAGFEKWKTPDVAALLNLGLVRTVASARFHNIQVEEEPDAKA